MDNDSNKKPNQTGLQKGRRKCKHNWNKLEDSEILNEVWREEGKKRSWSEISADSPL